MNKITIIGEGAIQDYEEAVKYHIRASEKGNPVAMNNYGVCLWNGFGTEEDKETAISYFRRASELGHAIGDFNVNCALSHENPESDYEFRHVDDELSAFPDEIADIHGPMDLELSVSMDSGWWA